MEILSFSVERGLAEEIVALQRGEIKVQALQRLVLLQFQTVTVPKDCIRSEPLPEGSKIGCCRLMEFARVQLRNHEVICGACDRLGPWPICGRTVRNESLACAPIPNRRSFVELRSISNPRS